MALVALALVGAAVVVVVRADGDPSCYGTRSTRSPAYAGRSASRAYDWVDVTTQQTPRFSPAVDIPAGLLDDRYVPQGLAGWPAWNGSGEDLLLISAYQDGDHDKVADGPSAVFAVVAGGPRAGTSLGRMLIAPGHVGGLAVQGGWLYVGSEHEIRGYRLTRVSRALAGDPGTGTVQPPDYSRPSSHDVASLGSGDGQVWAGRYSMSSPTPLTGYVQTSRSTGALELQPDAGILVPEQTQGVAVTAGQAVFSSSYGRLSRGYLRVAPRLQAGPAGAGSSCFRVPSMNEGVTVLDGRLYVLFESAAHTYDRGLLRPGNRITQVYSAALGDVTTPARDSTTAPGLPPPLR